MNKSILLLLSLLNIVNTYSQINLDIIKVPEAIKLIENHSNTITTPLVIAIIDKGVDLEHEDLKSNIWSNKNEIPNNGIDDDKNGFVDDYYGWNFANNTNDVSIGGLGSWHGTPINGIIGANNKNNIGAKGICYNIKLLNIVKGKSIKSIIESLNYVYSLRKTFNETGGQKGANIVAVNCSWGKDSLWAEDYCKWCHIYDSLGSIGVLSVSSVPNSNIDIDIYGDMPTTCQSDYLITVSNSTLYDKKVYDAGYGLQSVDLAAPGDGTYTTLNTGNYGYFGGTSAAAPYVTGTIGLIYQLPIDKFKQDALLKPSKVALDIKSAIIEGVDVIPDFETITVSGGRLNTFNSIKILCNNYGEQRLYNNLFKTLTNISIFPNPAIDQTTITIESNLNQKITITIIDLNGNSVYYSNSNTIVGFNNININLTGIDAGLYILNISTKHISESTRLLIK